MFLTRKQKEELVIDLNFNQNKTYRYIAKEVKMSLRDIQRLVGEEADRRQGGQSLVQSSQACALFHKGKSPIDVAIELNMREKEVTVLYVEYLRLNKPYDLCKIYEETKGLNSFLTLYRMTVESGMDSQHVVNTLKIANNDLRTVEQQYKTLLNEVNNLESRKQKLQWENDDLRSMQQRYSSACEQERTQLDKLCRQTKNQESFVEQFKNNDPTYQKIKKSVEDKVIGIFSNSKPLLQVVAGCLFQHMISEPNRCAELISCMGTEETKDRIIQALDDIYVPQPYLSEAERADVCISVIVEETDKVHRVLIRRLAREFFDKYVGNEDPKSSNELQTRGKQRLLDASYT